MRVACGWLCVVVGCVFFWGAPAVAKEVHVYKSSFGEEGSTAGRLHGPTGVAVNDSTHDVYVVDTGNNRVEEFDATGAFIAEFDGSGAPTGSFKEPTEIAVDNSGDPLDSSKEDVYVVDHGHGAIDKFTSNGVYQGQIAGTPCAKEAVPPACGQFENGETNNRSIKGIAIDPNGVVWVRIRSSALYEFSDALGNQYVSEINTVFGGAPPGLAVDSEDNLYSNSGGGEFVKVNSLGETLANPFGGDRDAFGVAVDPVGGEVYLDSNEEISAFSLGGEGIESFGSGLISFSDGVGVDASDGSVYVTDERADKVLVFEALILPDVSVGSLSGQSTRGVTLNGTVNPEGTEAASCVFEYAAASEYDASKTYSHSVPCVPGPGPSGIGSGKNPVSVSAALSGLVPETEYDYRLVAGNAAPVSNPSSNEKFFTGPLLGGEFATDVASSSVTLDDSINPNGADTEYYVEYGTTAGYGSYAPAGPPGVALGSGVSVLPVVVHLQNLEAGSSYHYRFVAVQDGEVFEEPDHTFSTAPAASAAGLIDGRAWELVSPPNKNGALIELFEQGGQVQAAADGGGITYVAEGPSVGEKPAGHVTYSQVLSERGTKGWTSTDLTLPGRLLENEESASNISHFQFEYRLFSPDLSGALVEPQIAGTPPLPPEKISERTLYLRNNLSGEYLPLVTPNSVPAGTKLDEPGSESEFEMHVLAVTPDLVHVVFKTPLALTPEAFDEESIHKNTNDNVQWNLYEWSDGRLGLVNILPGNEGVAHGRASTAPPVRLAGMTNGNGLGRGDAQRAVSNDGRRIAWTWGEPKGPAGYRGLFVRDMVEERTVRVGGPSAVYQTMNAAGSEVFYIENGELYVFNFENETTTNLTGKHEQGEASAGVQETVSGVSEDGAYVYFVAEGVLAAGGVKGGDNLYLLHDTGGGWTTTHIATLSAEDRPSWYAEAYEMPFLAHVSSRVSPNGQFFTFMSNRSLTGYDNTDAVSGQPDEEVFLYDAETERLACASCNPSGARPLGVFDTPQAELAVDPTGIWTSKESTGRDKHTDHWMAGSIPGWDELNGNPATYQPRYLSDSGRLFFDSPDALVSSDTNGLEDVYEFEPASVGSCTSSVSSFSDVSSGCVGLISSGTSSSESMFFDASEDGDDAFFATTAKLVGEDYDKGYDIYDAHVCNTSVPCKQAPVVPPPCTSGDSCKAAPSPQPEIFGAPPTATFNGAGNVTTTVTTTTSVKAKPLTEAQKLTRALKACAKKRRGKPRNTCMMQARKRYPVKKAHKS